MHMRTLLVSSTLIAALAGSGDAQPVRWNDRVAADTMGDAPAVRVWLEGARVYSYGAPVRVRFSVAQDAHVMVARVDGNGHVTVLYPQSRSRSTEVRGGSEVLVRGRRSGGDVSFFATDRWNGGYVFALASYDPFDLSRLSIRDFDRYVTGSYVGRPSRTYVGDPYRVIARFASMVLYDSESPFDYDVDFYSVDAPGYISSVGYSSLCHGFGAYGGAYRGLQERWDDEMYYGSGGGSLYDCSGLARCNGLSAWNGYSYFGFVTPLCYLSRGGGQIAGAPPVIRMPPRDSGRVGGWLTDSLRRMPPDTVSGPPLGEDRERIPRVQNGAGPVNGGEQLVGSGAIRRPPVGEYDDAGDRVYSIPDRALRNMRRRSAETGAGDLPTRPDARAPRGRDDGIRWLRPPEEIVVRPRQPDAEGALPRPRRGDANAEPIPAGGREPMIERGTLPPRRNGAGRGTDDGVRFSEPPRHEPPSRTQGPRFDAPMPSTRDQGAGRRIEMATPPRYDAPRDGPARPEPPPRVQSPPPPPPQPVERRDPPERKPPGGAQRQQ